MKLNWIVIVLTVLSFFVAGFLILNDQYDRVGVWFQISDVHHETFALVSFALGIGVIIGSLIKK